MASAYRGPEKLAPRHPISTNTRNARYDDPDQTIPQDL